MATTPQTEAAHRLIFTTFDGDGITFEGTMPPEVVDWYRDRPPAEDTNGSVAATMGVKFDNLGDIYTNVIEALVTNNARQATSLVTIQKIRAEIINARQGAARGNPGAADKLYKLEALLRFMTRELGDRSGGITDRRLEVLVDAEGEIKQDLPVVNAATRGGGNSSSGSSTRGMNISSKYIYIYIYTYVHI